MRPFHSKTGIRTRSPRKCLTLAQIGPSMKLRGPVMGFRIHLLSDIFAARVAKLGYPCLSSQ